MTRDAGPGRETLTEVIDLGNGSRDAARRAVIAAIVRSGVRPFLNGRVSLPVRRRALSLQGRLAQPVPKGVEVAEVALGGRRAWKLTPKGAVPGRTLFHLHGGGYNYGDIGTHGGGVATLARHLGATAWMPDYRVIPEAPVTAPLEDAILAWRDLAERVDTAGTVISGDSAGAHLALSLACEIRDTMPTSTAGALCLLSPWVDCDPAVTARRPADAILSSAVMALDVDLWLGGRDPKDPHVSPIHRPLAGLPPTLVQWGRFEALHHDAEALVAALGAAGVDVTGEAYEGLWHDAFLQVPMLVEASRWLARTAAWASQRVGAAPAA